MAGKRHDDGGLCLCDRADGTCAGLAEEIWTASSGILPRAGPGVPAGCCRSPIWVSRDAATSPTWSPPR
jgi:hypothetical protein